MQEQERRERIAQVLKQTRRDLGMSVPEVLQELDKRGLSLSDKTIYSWERGFRQPDADALLRLCDVYGIKSLSVFFSPSENDEGLARFSKDAKQVARVYDSLDRFGRAAVRRIAEVERERCLETASKAASSEVSAPRKTIPSYTYSAAAGPLLGITDIEYELYELQPGDPENAVYTVRACGNSMAPAIADGARLFVDMEPVSDGGVGVFCVDGSTVVKQYHFDEESGNTYLYSLNRDRADADVVLPAQAARSVTFQGRVIGHQDHALPREATHTREPY